MTNMEFEGHSEREAVAKAAAKLGSESFDVEILERSRSGIFGRGKVRIRVKPLTSIPDPRGSGNTATKSARESAPVRDGHDQKDKYDKNESTKASPEELEIPAKAVPKKNLQTVSEFVMSMIENMGYSAKVSYKENIGAKLVFEITSESSSILIGKKGKTLDALQLLASIYLNRLAGDEIPWRVVLDSEGYRARREESLNKLAKRSADAVAKTQTSRLLEPMNPFERRLIHTAISDREDVVTRSEGEGLYKRVRIIAKGKGRGRNRR